MSICFFCGQNETIKKSHVIPKYFFKWLKEYSFTKHIRSAEKDIKRVQDGTYLPLLCHDCEEMFSKHENIFKKNVFVYAYGDSHFFPTALFFLPLCLSALAQHLNS